MYQAEDPWSSALLFEAIKEKLTPFITAKKFNSCIDVGCGEGLFTEFFSTSSEAYLGVDVNSAALKRARNKNTETKIEYIKADFDSLSSSNKKYDLVVFNFVLDYLGFQDHPNKFTSHLYFFIQKNILAGATVVLVNPIYKQETWDRLQKYQFIFEQFGFKTIHREMFSAPDQQIGLVILKKKF